MPTKLYEVIANVMNVPIDRINDESNIENIETWDSFHGLILLDDLETIFNITFTVNEIIGSKSVSDIKKNLQKHGVLHNG